MSEPPAQGYAQTSIQLFAQLRRAAYSPDDRRLIAKAYDLCARLFAGRYRESGKTFIAHVVGTASVLTAVGAPATLVAAGLLHSAYSHGDFGTWRRGVTKRKRAELATALGAEVEAYVYRFTERRARGLTLGAVRDDRDALDAIDRHDVTLWLANKLDNYADLGEYDSPHAQRRRQTLRQLGPELVTIAERLGLPALATEFSQARARLETVEHSPNLRTGERVTLPPPSSYRRPMRIAWLDSLVRACRRLRLLVGL